VLVEDVDGVDAEPSQGGVGDLADVLGAAVHAEPFAVGAQLEPELGGDHDLLPGRGRGLRHELLVRVGPVDLSGVEERDATLDGRADEAGHFGGVSGGPEAVAHAHAAKPDR